MIVSTCRVVVAFSYAIIASGSDPLNDVTHEVSVDPVGDVIIHIFNLELLWNFRAFGATNDVYHVSHVPCPIFSLDDHGHSCLDV